MHFEALSMDVVWDSDDFILGDNSSVESIFKSNNFGWSTMMIDGLDAKTLWFTLDVQMDISRNYDVILDILEGEMVFLRIF